VAVYMREWPSESARETVHSIAQLINKDVKKKGMKLKKNQKKKCKLLDQKKV
jgi:hypothetical protein